MLAKKLRWMKNSDNISDEIRQCNDEGRDISGLLPKSEEVQHMPDGVEKEDAAACLLNELESRPLRADYAYVEPESYEGIQMSLEHPSEQVMSLSPSRCRSAITGAWIGRAAGCLLGIPVECWTRQKIRDFLQETGQYPLCRFMTSDIKPELKQKFDIHDLDPDTPYDRQKKCWINNVGAFPVDDDTNYTMMSLRITERCGVHFTSEDVAESWLFSLPALHVCSAERIAYRNLLNRILPPNSGIYLNPFREWIGAQIRADFYGYIAAGRPAQAARMAYQDASVSHTKNGVYAAMYVAALISLAAVSTDTPFIVSEALRTIPPKSRFYEKISYVLSLFYANKSYQEMIDEIHKQYNENIKYDWCHAIPNSMIVTASLLYHGHDYTAAITGAVLAGFDTDCNGATVGSAVGILLGEEAIDTVWKDSIRPILSASVCGYTQIPIEEIVSRTLVIMRQAAE